MLLAVLTCGWLSVAQLVISYLGVLLTPSPSLPGDVSGRGVAAAMAQIAVRRVESFKQLVLAVTPAEVRCPHVPL